MTTRSKPPTDESGRQQEIGGLRKAAILMRLLGDEAAKEIYKHLDSDERSRLRREIAELGAVSPESASDVLQEYNWLSAAQAQQTRPQDVATTRKLDADGIIVSKKGAGKR